MKQTILKKVDSQEIREETPHEYFYRVAFEKDLEHIDNRVNVLIQEICDGNSDVIDEYQQLVNLYSHKCLEEESKFLIPSEINGIKPTLTKNAIRLDKDGNVFYVPQRLRSKAFMYKKTVAAKMITAWLKKHESTENCPNTYQDTLNIPFQQIKPV
jgi:hypothetical protein